MGNFYNFKLMLYVHQYPDWTHFRYDSQASMNALGVVRRIQGKLIGLAEICGADDIEPDIIAQEMVASFEIDNQKQDLKSIREDIQKKANSTRHFVTNSLGVVQNASNPLTIKRLFNWHSALSKKNPFRFRMVDNILNVTTSSEMSQELNFVGPHHENLPTLVQNFLNWFETNPMDGMVKAAIAQFWFLTLRPFEEVNGKIARMITAMQLIRSSDSGLYLYPINEKILEHREEYFKILNKAQRSSGDITEWILWFLNVLHNAMEESLKRIGEKAKLIQFKQRFAQVALDVRQQSLVNDAMTGKLPQPFSAKNVASILGVSHDTALREIQSLISKNIFKAEAKGGRSQKYRLA